MNFLLKRYLHGISKRRFWLLLVFILPCLYLFTASLQADRFTITQAISLYETSPVAITSKPTGSVLLKDVVAEPESFFQNNFAVNTLTNDIFVKNSPNQAETQSLLIDAVKNNMSMEMTGSSMMQIKYHGTDAKTGSILVGYYSKRLLQGAKEGLIRTNTTLAADASAPALIEGLYTIEHRALWRPGRLLPVLQLFIASCLGVLVLLWGMEWSDSSFKSERQLGRYLDIPVLGSVPDLGSVSDLIDSNPELA